MWTVLLLAFTAACLTAATTRQIRGPSVPDPIRHIGADDQFSSLLERWIQDDAWKTYGLDPEPSRLVAI